MDLVNIEFIVNDLKVLNSFEEIQNSGYCAYLVNTQLFDAQVRVSKITNKKNGQFVCVWQKDLNNQNSAYLYQNFPDFLIVYCQNNNFIGKFVFPKDVLCELGILKTKNNKGKMGFRVYPSWDEPQSKQAFKTQKKQLEFFKIM